MAFRGRTKRDVLQEFRHAEILEAARKVFAQKGFNEASVDDIAHEAGLAKGTLYLYYPSKREIYWEAFKCGFVELCNELERQVEAARTIEDKIRAFVVTKLTYFENNRDFYRIYYAEFGNAVTHPACAQKEFRDLHRRQMKILSSVLEDGIKQRAIRDLPAEAVAFAILDFTRGVITQRLLGWSKTTIEEGIALIFDLTWKGLAGR